MQINDNAKSGAHELGLKERQNHQRTPQSYPSDGTLVPNMVQYIIFGVARQILAIWT